MNRFFPTLLSVPVLMLALACGDDSDPVAPPTPPPAPPPAAAYDFSPILNAYVDGVVVATYADLDAQATTLNEAVQAFAADPTQDNLNAAAEAWIATREPWEASEGFLFGPVAFLSLDPSLDSWPLDQAQLQEVLDSNFELSPDFIYEGLNAALRGFHTVEFLLFRGGEPRNAADVTERETEYLVAATQVLYDDAALLHESWTSAVDGVGPRAFGEEFKNAGNAGSRYLSHQEAILELIEGMIVIADEVGNGKISDPFTQQGTRPSSSPGSRGTRSPTSRTTRAASRTRIWADTTRVNVGPA